MWLWSWQVSGSLTAFTCERRASVGLEHEWEQAASPARGSCHAACGFDDKEQVHGCKFVGLTKTKAAKQQKEGGWHIFHSLHGCQQWWFIRGEEKKKRAEQRRWPTWRERANERERAGGSAARAVGSISGLSVYLWVVSCPQPLLEIHAEWERCTSQRKCFRPSPSRDAASHLGQAVCFPPVSLFQWFCRCICTVKSKITLFS